MLDSGDPLQNLHRRAVNYYCGFSGLINLRQVKFVTKIGDDFNEKTVSVLSMLKSVYFDGMYNSRTSTAYTCFCS